jgi:hypothetical protein
MSININHRAILKKDLDSSSNFLSIAFFKNPVGPLDALQSAKSPKHDFRDFQEFRKFGF